MRFLQARRPPPPRRGYGGFHTTGAIMQHLARVDPSLGGAVMVPGPRPQPAEARPGA